MDPLQYAQKRNELARTMVKNGLAPNLADALDMIKKQEGEQAMKETETQSTLPDARVAKIEQVLQDFGRFFVDYKSNAEKNISEMQGTIKQHKADILYLKEQIDAIKKQALSRPVVQEPASKSEEPKKEQPYNQRRGDFTSNDVKIEDFFSNAHNKMMKKP